MRSTSELYQQGEGGGGVEEGGRGERRRSTTGFCTELGEEERRGEEEGGALNRQQLGVACGGKKEKDTDSWELRLSSKKFFEFFRGEGNSLSGEGAECSKMADNKGPLPPGWDTKFDPRTGR